MPRSSKPIVGVIGSRSITDINLDLFINPDHCGCIVSGEASGIDTLAEQFAKRNKIEFVCYSANWKLYGKKAGAIRNREIVEFADIIIAFHDGRSKGTLITLEYCKQMNVPYICHLIQQLD